MPPLPSMDLKIYGTTTMNEKGQIVIPAEARSALKLEAGARLMVLKGRFGNGIMVVKTEAVEAQMKTWDAALSQPQIDNPAEGQS